MQLNGKATELLALAGVIDPDAYAAGTYTTAWVSAKNFAMLAALVSVGDMVATSTVNAKLEQATSSGGAGAKDITGKAITALTQAGADDNKQAWINVKPEELDVDNGFAFVRLSMTVATAASDSGGFLFGYAPSRGPATDVDLTSVDEVVG
jgi:hypothetical protein